MTLPFKDVHTSPQLKFWAGYNISVSKRTALSRKTAGFIKKNLTNAASAR